MPVPVPVLLLLPTPPRPVAEAPEPVPGRFSGLARPSSWPCPYPDAAGSGRRERAVRKASASTLRQHDTASEGWARTHPARRAWMRPWCVVLRSFGSGAGLASTTASWSQRCALLLPLPLALEAKRGSSSLSGRLGQRSCGGVCGGRRGLPRCSLWRGKRESGHARAAIQRAWCHSPLFPGELR